MLCDLIRLKNRSKEQASLHLTILNVVVWTELEPARARQRAVLFSWGPWPGTYLLHHKLLKLLHNLCQTEPLEPGEESNDAAAHLHEKQIHLDLVDQPRVQDLHKNQQWQHQPPWHSTAMSSSDTFQIYRTQLIRMGGNQVPWLVLRIPILPLIMLQRNILSLLNSVYQGWRLQSHSKTFCTTFSPAPSLISIWSRSNIRFL